jgi:hypothetical protein
MAKINYDQVYSLIEFVIGVYFLFITIQKFVDTQHVEIITLILSMFVMFIAVRREINRGKQ